MEPLLVQLIISGATTLISAAATDLWKDARAGFARLFGRGDADREKLASHDLDELTAMVEASPPAERDSARKALLPLWEKRLNDLLSEDPSATDGLRQLCDQLQARLAAPQQQWVQNITASGQASRAFGVMGGGRLDVHEAPPPVDLSSPQSPR